MIPSSSSSSTSLLLKIYDTCLRTKGECNWRSPGQADLQYKVLLSATNPFGQSFHPLCSCDSSTCISKKKFLLAGRFLRILHRYLIINVKQFSTDLGVMWRKREVDLGVLWKYQDEYMKVQYFLLHYPTLQFASLDCQSINQILFV